MFWKMRVNKLVLIIFCLFILDFFVWGLILFPRGVGGESLYFFDVGQGDSQMISLGNIQMLIDGGPNAKILSELPKAMSTADRYVDIVILSHPELDHFGGLIDVLKNYRVGLFIDNGRGRENAAYSELRNLIAERKINYLALAEGDRIKYKDDVLEILSPSSKLSGSKELNDTALVLKFESPKFNVLYTSDIGFDVEKELLKKFNLSANVLKVAHHGSKYSSSKEFLAAVSPKAAIFEVGKNSYGHPTKEVLSRIAEIGAQIFRTDTNGTIKFDIAKDVLNISTTN